MDERLGLSVRGQLVGVLADHRRRHSVGSDVVVVRDLLAAVCHAVLCLVELRGVRVVHLDRPDGDSVVRLDLIDAVNIALGIIDLQVREDIRLLARVDGLAVAGYRKRSVLTGRLKEIDIAACRDFVLSVKSYSSASVLTYFI